MEEPNRFQNFAACEMISVIPARNRWRFYRIEIMPGLFSLILSRAWGRIGCNVRIKEEYYGSLEDATERANRLYQKKIRRGYQEVKSIRDHIFLPQSRKADG
jgi:predicted DNA-binding WGR domain protein